MSHITPWRVQRALDAALALVLAGAPRRSVLLMDTDKEGPDGGCAPCPRSRPRPAFGSPVHRQCGYVSQHVYFFSTGSHQIMLFRL